MVSARHSTEVTNLKDILSDLIPKEQKKIAAFRFARFKLRLRLDFSEKSYLLA